MLIVLVREMTKKQIDGSGVLAPMRSFKNPSPSDERITQFALHPHVVRAIIDPHVSIRDLVRCPKLSRPMLAKLVNDFLEDSTLK